MKPPRISSVAAVLSKLSSRQFARFVMVGLWNTLAGYLIFAAFNFLLSRRFPTYGYVAASVLSSIINVTMAFLGYKWFVFRTSGNYVREWLRTVSVYSVGICVSVVLLPVIVYVLHSMVGVSHDPATYLGALLLTLISAIWNFVGNKNFSFKPEPGSMER